MNVKYIQIHSFTSESSNLFQSLFSFDYSKAGNFCLLGINNQTFMAQILTVLSPLAEKFNFSIPWDLKIKATLITKRHNEVTLNQSFKIMSERQGPLHGRETASIIRFSAETFESDF